MRKQLSGGGVRVLLSLFVLCLGVGIFLRYSEKASSQKADTDDVVQSGQVPVASQAVAFGISQAVRDLPEVADPNWALDPERAARAAARRAKQEDKIKNPFNAKTIKNIVPGAGVAGSNYAFRDEALPDAPAQPSVVPTPGVSFDGLSSQDNQATFGTTFAPPDTVGDVGPNHYVQMTNTLVRIFNKNGTPASAPFLLSSITNVVGGPCVNQDDGDPIVNYDPLANRWILSQFCPGPVPGHQMFAVSTTPDPTGSYYVYDFVNPSGSFFDYPHVGVWPDAYYMTVNQFNQAGTAFLGAGAFAYDRVKMLQGDPTASYVYFDQFGSICPTCGGQLPTDLDGTITPPAGMGNLIMEYTADEFGDAADGLRIFEFKPNFTTPASSTFTQITPDLGFAAFDARQPTGRTDIEQAGTATNLDSIADRLMFRVAYRNLGTVASPINSWVMNFTVNVGGATPASAATYQAGIRWAEIRRAGANGAFSVANQGTQATNPGTPAGGTNSWMGSVAQDKDGNILLGYSTSGNAVATDFPSLRYAGRQATDPANTFQAQVDGFLGTGFQAGAGSRWGDYSAMSVDPTDECSFWYTQEYRSSANNGNAFLWNTRVLGNIKFPTCTAPSRGTVSGTITSCASGLPLANAVVTLAGGFLATTNASGQYTIINVPPGTTSASATKAGGFSVASNNSVVVTGGATTTVNLCLAGVPVLAPGTVTIVSESCLPANGAVDPGETVTVSLPVLNTGGANTVNDVGTLAASGGVLTPSAAQNYGVVTSGGAAVSRNYTFTASPSLSCGTNITATVAHQDGASSLGNVVYTIPTGAVTSALSQNFDAVTVPALPAGWVATNVAGAAPLWVTATGSNHTAPNVAFVDDPASITDKVLDTPSLTAAAGSQLSFRHAWTLESGFDGGVLEISINGGAFADILAAGGSFAAGGYTGPISTSFASPIAGRQAWTGTQAAFVTTTVNLPAAAAGQPIRLRFRMASDSSVAGTGWRVDTVAVSSRSCCGAVAPTPTPTVVPTATPTPGPTPVSTPTPVPTPTPTPGTGTTVSYTGPAVTIPDAVAAGVNVPLAVGTACTISDLNFRFDGTPSAVVGNTGVGVTHSWVGDLIFKLTSPTGTAVTFYDRPGVPASTFGCSNNNLAQVILDDQGGFPSIETTCDAAGSGAAFPSGSFTPNNPLSAFNGQAAAGTWTLNVSDNGAGDTGTVNRFSLVFTCAGGGPTPTPTPAPTATPTPTPVPTTFVAFSSTTYKEDESQSATVTVNRTGVTTGTTNATVTLTSGGRAVGGAACAAGVDYQNTPQAVTFAAGETSKTVTIPLCIDISADTDETVNLTLTNLSALTGASNSSVLTINDTANQFKNPSAISIIQGTAAGLYPSPILVSGATTNAFRIRVTLYDFYSTKPDNLDVLLVGPNGAKYALVGDVGGPVAITEAGAVTLTLADYPNAVLPDSGPLATGIFKPTTCETPVTNFPAPAPAGPYVEPGCVVARTNAQTLFGNFGGSTANGTWNLYIRDDNGVARPDSPDVVNGEVKGGWGIELLPSTAAGVEVSGRVLTPDGRGLRNATVTIIDSMGNRRTATTGSFGYYQFTDVEAGGSYTVGVSARRYRFTPRILQVQDTLTDVDFVGQE